MGGQLYGGKCRAERAHLGKPGTAMGIAALAEKALSRL
jgi:hypothetical protein